MPRLRKAAAGPNRVDVGKAAMVLPDVPARPRRPKAKKPPAAKRVKNRPRAGR